MKTKLLKKVRRRYKISKLKVEPWQAHSNEFFDRDCWHRQNADGECFVTMDSHTHDYDHPQQRVSSSYEEAYNWLVFFIKKDYPTSSVRLAKREKIIWGAEGERASLSALIGI